MVAFVFALVGVPAEAKTKVKIQGNTNGSDNKVIIDYDLFDKVKQQNYANQLNVVSVLSSTGDNNVKNNTGKGAKTINTGPTTTNTTITNKANKNENTGSNCGCVDPDTTVKITGNTDSDNTVKIEYENKKIVKQENEAYQSNTVIVGSNTGGNDAKGNTGKGDVDITTGSSTVVTTITNEANMNVNL